MIGSTADEIEYWRAEAHKLAALLMSEYTFVHERKIAEVDEALKPYYGDTVKSGLQGSGTADLRREGPV